MIDLAQRSEPYEIALPYGLSVTVKPLTTAGMAAAQAAARRAVEAIERQARERSEAGLTLDGLPDLSPEGERDGFYQARLIRELAIRHVTGWRGVELEGGPAPSTSSSRVAAEADRLWRLHVERNGPALERIDVSADALPALSFGEYLDDRSPMPADIIAPRLLTRGGLLVLGGAPMRPYPKEKFA